MGSALNEIYKAVKALSKTKEARDLAMQRAERLPELIPVENYRPRAIARSTLELPNAQRGWSEDMTAVIPPVEATLIRPSEFLGRSDPLVSGRDEQIIRNLIEKLPVDGLKELPVVQVNELPDRLMVGFDGRHRMKALQELYGDDPVLVNWLKGSQLDDFGHYRGESNLSPLEIMKRDVDWGDQKVKLTPLWMDKPR